MVFKAIPWHFFTQMGSAALSAMYPNIEIDIKPNTENVHKAKSWEAPAPNGNLVPRSAKKLNIFQQHRKQSGPMYGLL